MSQQPNAGKSVTLRNGMRMRLDIHPSLEALEDCWRQFDREVFNSPHQSFDWCRAWQRKFNRPLQIVQARIEGETAFILPLEIVRGKLFTRAQFMGSEHANINTGLMSAAFLDYATSYLMEDIVAHLRESITGADCIILSNMPGQWRGRQMPFSTLPHVENQNHAFQLELKSTFTETLAQLNAKRRRKKYSLGHRRLEAAGGYEHIVARNPKDSHSLLDLFFSQKAARLAEFGLPNAFACPKTRAFLHEALEAPQDDGDFPLRMHAIRMTGGDHAGAIPAIAGLTRKGDHTIVQFCSIDKGPLMEASPGELLFHLMIDQYNALGSGIFDFGIGDMAFKRSWCNIETVQVNVNLPVTSLGRLAALKEEASTRLKTVVKQNPALYQFLQRIRSRSKSGEPDALGED